MISYSAALVKNIILLKQLKSLKFNFGWCKKISDIGFLRFSRCVSELAQLECLYLNFTMCDKLSDVGLQELGRCIKKLIQLTSLKLDFYSPKESIVTLVMDPGFEALSDGLSQMSQLAFLDLNLDSSHDITDKGLMALGQILPKLKSLLILNLNLKVTPYSWNGSGRKISNIGMDKLGESLAQMIQLQRLSLNFQGCEKISGIGLINLTQSASRLPQLESIKLCFAYCKQLKNKDIEQVSDSMGKMQQLLLLSLDFTNCIYLTFAGLTKMFDSLSRLTEVRELCLDFRGCGILVEKLSNVSGFSPFIAILFGAYRVGDKKAHSIATKKLCDCLLKMNHLEVLDLGFPNIPMSDEEYIEIAESALKSPQLRSCRMSFWGNVSVSENAINTVRENMEKHNIEFHF